MKYELIDALKQIEREKGISFETIIETLEIALLSAYRKKYGTKKNIRVEVDKSTGDIRIFKIIKEKDKDNKEDLITTPSDFGRIAAQTVKQVVKQRLKEASREVLYQEFKDMVGEIMTGIIRQTDQRFTLVDLGKAEALLPLGEQIPGEKYELGERIKCYIVDVKKTTKGPQVIVSRTHPGLLKRLFELEVPEMADGIVEIKGAVRESGYRSKIAVSSNDENIDPVGACVGQRGCRVRMVVNELSGEKIDIVQYSDDVSEFIKNSLSPSKVSDVFINNEKKLATVIVPDDQVSLAIGKDGHNARLAAKITKWKIDIKSENQWAIEKIKEIEKKEEKVKKKEKKIKAEAKRDVEEEKVKKLREKKKCKAILKSGEKCTYSAKPGSDYCGIHKKFESKKK
jgi:N utilization substance protein A